MTLRLRFRCHPPHRFRGASPFVAALLLALVGCSLAVAPVNPPRDPGMGQQPRHVLIDRVTRVRDGDTLVVGLIPVRIANLDCPERDTPAGDAATAFVRQLVDGAQLRCTLEGRKSYDREVGVCALADGRDLGDVVLGAAMCGQWG